MADHGPVQGVSKSQSVDAQRMQAQRAKALQRGRLQNAERANVAKEMTQITELSLFNPLAMSRRFETLKDRFKRASEENQTSETEKSHDDVQEILGAEKIAEEFERQNHELERHTLLNIKAQINEGDTIDDILGKILDAYPDRFLADEALDFLIETTYANSKLGRNLLIAKDRLHELYGKEIRAGRNVNDHAQTYSKQGLGTAMSLRDLYREIISNPREPIDLFDELVNKFPFPRMKELIGFVLHAIGTDMKCKGPSIDPIELRRLFTEARSMQAILGVYRFFLSRMKLIEKQFSLNGLILPKGISFEELSKQLVKLIGEKYPSPDKVLRIATLLGLTEELIAQTVIFTQYRDALRQISPRLFRNQKHRQDLLLTIIDTIEDLDEMIDEEEDEEDE
ncbi:MAG: hypothetical protein S4CHLAM102_07840 [Chlamydiia bacterium]|nr:hypothetical protein [Chlamydiia bacterium]